MHFKGQHRDRANDDRRADDEEGVHPNGIAMPVTRQATTTNASAATGDRVVAIGRVRSVLLVSSIGPIPSTPLFETTVRL
jgi:hypothetical protein